MKFSNIYSGALRRLAAPMSAAVMILVLVIPSTSLAQEKVDRKWGIGWDDGLTARMWLSGRWELAVAAGPDDYLNKVETRSWYLDTPEAQQGLLEVPEDIREEHGWVRFQLGRLLKKKDSFAVVAYGGLVYEWIVHQERTLMLHELNNNYDTFELDRHTERWILTLGFRPSWQPTSFLTVETGFGLNFIMENWDQSTNRTWSGVEGHDYQESDGHGQQFEDFGLEGMASIQIFIWL
jgi:hypothetical protein